MSGVEDLIVLDTGLAIRASKEFSTVELIWMPVYFVNFMNQLMMSLPASSHVLIFRVVGPLSVPFLFSLPHHTGSVTVTPIGWGEGALNAECWLP